VSDLLEAAASALGTPAALVSRSAAARAEANGTTADEILAAWAGGAPVSAAPAEPVDAPAPEAAPPEPEAETPQQTAAPTPEPLPVAVAVEVVEEPEAELEPVPLAERVRTAVRVGSWVGAGLGLVGFLAAGMVWAPAAVIPSEGESVAVEVTPLAAMIAIAAVSVVFGAIVASASRAAASWRNPAMQLSGSRTATAWTGAAIGLVLGVAGAALLTMAVGTPVGEEETVVLLPVLATLTLMVVGGAVLGALTAAVPQLVGTPVAVADTERSETEELRRRLGATVGVPLAGIGLLALLVLPFAYALIESNHLTRNGAAVVAIITAGGILGFAALSGNRPNVRISIGELLVAVVAVGTILAIIFAVLVFRDSPGDSHAGANSVAEHAL
jgi:MFS family permease